VRKHRGGWTREIGLDELDEALERHDRELIEQCAELLRNRTRQDVLAEAEDLPEFDVRRPEKLHSAPKLRWEREVAQVCAEEGPHERRADVEESIANGAPRSNRAAPRPIEGNEAAGKKADEVAVRDEEAPNDTRWWSLLEALERRRACGNLSWPMLRGTASRRGARCVPWRF
jgi:hypothetical protein